MSHVKHLLGIEDVSSDEIWHLLKMAKEFKGQINKKHDHLLGKTVVNLFFEASTRTRSSFEIAAKRLGADVVFLQQKGSAVEKGETLVDTARNIEAMQPDAIVLRHQTAGTPYILSKALDVPIINAGDGFHEHPTQALLDCLTIWGQIEPVCTSQTGGQCNIVRPSNDAATSSGKIRCRRHV
jgi:aspartate carbamoyltransferase catalytic subunit